MSMKTQRVVYGVDADTKGLAWCCLEVVSKRVVREGHIMRQYKTQGPVDTYALDLEHFVNMLGDNEVYLEDVFCRSHKGFKSLCKVQGEFLYEACSRAFIPQEQIILVPAVTWQSWLFKKIGKKRLANLSDTKEKAKFCISSCVDGGVLADEHAVDAACLAYYGAIDLIERGVVDV